MKPSVERMGLEENHILQQKNREGKGQRVCARLGQKWWQQDWGALLCPQES